MAIVVVERSFEEPTEFERLLALERAAHWCFEQQRVRWLRSFQSHDARHQICIYEAPDAEAVRVSQRTAELPFDDLWSGQRFSPPVGQLPPGQQEVVVQRAMPEALNEESAMRLYEQGAYCRSLYRIQQLESYLSADGRRLLCRYSAPDTEAVRLANTQSKLPFERAWPAVEHVP